MKKTRVLALLAVLCIMVALTACGGNTSVLTDPVGGNGEYHGETINAISLSREEFTTVEIVTVQNFTGLSREDDSRTFVDLRQGSIEVSAQDLANYRFFTNSTKITVTIPSGDFEGEFLLYGLDNDTSFIQSFTLNRNNRSMAFTNLFSERDYSIEVSGIDGSVQVTISQ